MTNKAPEKNNWISMERTTLFDCFELESRDGGPAGSDELEAIKARCRPNRWWLLWLIVVVILGADFAHRAVRDEAKTRFTYNWTARWMQSPADESVVCFRKTFDVSGHVRNGYLLVAADNSYNLLVNGQLVYGRFRTVNSYRLDRLHSTYNMVGYGRRYSIAQTFDIQPLLRPGRNVISIIAQSDSERPALLVEGAVMAGTTTRILSGPSWKSSPNSMTNWQDYWPSKEPIDTQWPQAEVGPSRGTPFVDGDVSSLHAPPVGTFIQSPVQTNTGQMTYRYRFRWDERDGSGWVRLITHVPFDLSLNGEPLVTTAHVNRSWQGTPTRRNAIDVYSRILLGGQPARYPSIGRKYRANTVFFLHTFQRGWNTLSVTTHDTMGLVDRSTPDMIQVDGEVRGSAGQSVKIHSGPDWDAVNAGGVIAKCVTVATARGIDTLDNNIYSSRPSTRVGVYDPTGMMARYTAVAAVICALVLGLLVTLGKLLPGRPVATLRNSIIAPAFVLVCACLAETAFEQSRESIILDSPQTCMIVLAAAGTAWLLMAAWAIVGATRYDPLPALVEGVNGESNVVLRMSESYTARKDTRSITDKVGPFFLGIIVILAAILYTHNLDYYGFLPDEYVSMLAARGIARHGIPIYENSGIIYTRSALFHYLLAPLVGAYGDPNPFLVRGYAGVWQLFTIVLAFVFGRAIRGTSTGLFAAALVAFSPMMTFYAREVRFYTQETFFVTLAMYFMWRSTREPQITWYRAGTWLAFSAAYLSQQLALAILPSIFLVILVTRSSKQWLTGWTLAAMIAAFGVMAADFIAYIKLCQTPLPFVDDNSVILIGLHTDVLESVPHMLLIGDERSHLVVGILFVIGLFAAIFSRKAAEPAKEAKISSQAFVYCAAIPIIALTGLITPRPAERYAVHAYPLTVLAAALALAVIVTWLRRYLAPFTVARPRRIDFALICGIAIAVLALTCYRPARSWNNTGRAIVAGVTQATRYVRTAERPGDRVMFFSPEAAMMDLGKCDYFFHQNSHSIYLYYAKDGSVRERNSAAICVDTTDKLVSVMSNNKRMWLVIPQWQTVASKGNRLAFVNVLTANFTLMHQVHGIQVWLWDKDLNHFHHNVHDYQSAGPGYSEVEDLDGGL